jgi:hypothetical protein
MQAIKFVIKINARGKSSTCGSQILYDDEVFEDTNLNFKLKQF